MQDQKINVSFFLDKSRPNTDNRCLIKMNIYWKPVKKRYATIYHATEEEWTKLNGSNLRDKNLIAIRQKLNALQLKAEKTIENIVPFSFAAFEEAFYDNDKTQARKSTSLQKWFDDYITNLKQKGQVGTAISYRTTINSLNDFKKNLHVHDITPAFLESYERHMLSHDKSTSTIGIYLRQLRAIINQAINENMLPQEKYPFKKYQIPAGRNIKKALIESDVSLLLNYTAKKEDLQKALDFWTFSYLCNGMNFADIIALKHENIDGDYLHFIRKKSKRTKKKDLRPIRVGLSQRAKEIIAKYKTDKASNPYLFSVLETGLSDLTEKYRGQRFIKWVNKRMEVIRQELEISQKIGTYAARHTFSTVLKRKGVSTEYIKEALGHSSVATTESYLDSFADDVKLQYANLLTNF